jgi:PAS domain S-box-containing protein
MLTRSSWWRYGMALLAVVLAVLLRAALIPVIGLNVPYVTLYPAMMVGAVMFGAAPGVFATIVGIVLAELLFVEPIGQIPLTMSLAVRSTIVLLSSFYLGHLGQSLRNARDQAQASERQSRVQVTALQSAANAIVITGPDGLILWVNQAFTRLTGYDAAEAIGQNPRVLKSGQHDATFYKGLWDTISTGRVWRGEMINQRKDGSLYTEEMTITPVADAAGVISHYIAIKQDVTDRKRVEEALKRAHDELEFRVEQRTAELRSSNETLARTVAELERREDEVRKLNQELKLRLAQLETSNKELESFAYSVSHDLRAPLRSIDGFSRALLEDYADKLDEEGMENLRIICAASTRMGQLIDDLLALSRVTRSELRQEGVDLSALVESIVRHMKAAHPEREVDVVIQPSLWAKADPNLLRIVLENLIANAWKFTSKKPRAEIEFGQKERNGEPAFFLRDNGAGFEMAYVHKIFGAFQRLHSTTEFPGTGVGLATVQRIIHRHGGQVWAEGEPGKGACFYFSLPAATTEKNP